MKDMNEYLKKLDKMATPTNQPKFADSEPLAAKDVGNLDELEDYKELKDMVKDIENGGLARRGKLAPIPIPVKTNERKR